MSDIRSDVVEEALRIADRAKQEGLDGEEASIKAHKKSGEAAEEYTEYPMGLSSAGTSCHQNF